MEPLDDDPDNAGHNTPGKRRMVGGPGFVPPTTHRTSSPVRGADAGGPHSPRNARGAHPGELCPVALARVIRITAAIGLLSLLVLILD